MANRQQEILSLLKLIKLEISNVSKQKDSIYQNLCDHLIRFLLGGCSNDLELVFEECSNVFSFNLPYFEYLIPVFVERIRFIFWEEVDEWHIIELPNQNKEYKQLSESITFRLNCIKILCSLLSRILFQKRQNQTILFSYSLLQLNDSKEIIDTAEKQNEELDLIEISCEKLWHILKDMTMNFLALERNHHNHLSENNLKNISLLLNAVTHMGFEQLYESYLDLDKSEVTEEEKKKNLFWIEECLKSLLDPLYDMLLHPQILLTCLECLELFSSENQIVTKLLSGETLLGIVERLLGAIGEHLHQLNNNHNLNINLKNLQEMSVAKMFYILSDWWMMMPSSLMTPKFTQQLTEVFLCAFEYQKDFILPEKKEKSKKIFGLNINPSNNSTPEMVHTPLQSQQQRKVSFASLHSHSNHSIGNEGYQNEIREAAINVLIHYYHFYSNDFSSSHCQINEPQMKDSHGSAHSPTSMSSNINLNGQSSPNTEIRNEEPELKMMFTNGHHIWSWMTFGDKILLLNRNRTGKYAWQFQQTDDPFEGNEKREMESFLKFFGSINENYMKQFFEKKPLSLVDRLENGTNNDEKHSSYIDVGQKEMILERFKELNIKFVEKYKQDWNKTKNSLAMKEETSDSLDNEPLKEIEKIKEKDLTVFSLLIHLGFFDISNHSMLKMDTKNPNLWRDLKVLDKKFGRETIKAGLIYVAKGQEDEQAILNNHIDQVDISPDYINFCKALAWEIEVNKHKGFLGGLERNGSNGSHALYYCTDQLEMIFHDITRMPNDEQDPKHLKKKRHIGNDHVHIIWNENDNDYQPKTIGGDFGNFQIQIRKSFHEGLYRVQIYRDHGVSDKGPLWHNCLVPITILAPMVRMTAIHAFRTTLQQHHHKTLTVSTSSSTSLIPNKQITKHHSYTDRKMDLELLAIRYGHSIESLDF